MGMAARAARMDVLRPARDDMSIARGFGESALELKEAEREDPWLEELVVDMMRVLEGRSVWSMLCLTRCHRSFR